MPITKVLLDTNIALDYLQQREPFSKSANLIFKLIADKKIKSFVSALTIVDLHYFLRKHLSKNKTISALKSFIKFISVIGVNPKEIISALNFEEFSDFEDAVQYFTALEEKIDCILTRDKKGFKKAVNIEVMAPDEFLVKFALK